MRPPDSDLASARHPGGDSWPCPSCEENVSGTLMDGDIALPGRPKKQYATCPHCSATLVHEPEADDANLRGWHLKPEPPPPRRLSML